MKTLNTLVEELIRQNPELADNPSYLVIEAWRQQGLKLYPHQRELLLSGKLAAAEAIGRAGRRAKAVIRKEDIDKRRRIELERQRNSHTTRIKVQQF